LTIERRFALIGHTHAGGGGVTDHGALTGLADNDHPQYSLVGHTHAATGSQRLAQTSTTTTVASTAAETTLDTVTVTGGTVGALNDMLEYECSGLINNTTAATRTGQIRVKVAGGTWTGATFSVAVGDSIGFIIRFRLFRLTSTTGRMSYEIIGSLTSGGMVVQGEHGIVNSSVTWASDVALTTTIQLSAADAALSAVKYLRTLDFAGAV
jgi:hypothetical protein